MSNPKMPDLNALMKQAQKLQGDVAKVQEEIAKITCDGAAGGGLVTATVNGQFDVVRVKIDKSVVDPNDVGMLEDLITAAINAAATKVRETSKEKEADLPPLGQVGRIFNAPQAPAPREEARQEPKVVAPSQEPIKIKVDEDEDEWGAVPSFLRRPKIK